MRFTTGPAGTYHYWATTTGMPLVFRAVGDTQLSGAFVVDRRRAVAESDRVFVITDWTSLTLDQLNNIASAHGSRRRIPRSESEVHVPDQRALMAVTRERLTYRLAENVRWRVINLSTQAHTMHLHGFYYRGRQPRRRRAAARSSPPDKSSGS